MSKEVRSCFLEIAKAMKAEEKGFKELFAKHDRDDTGFIKPDSFK